MDPLFEIKPNGIYSAEQLGEIFRGKIKIQKLRDHGLKSFPGSCYWGRNIISAIDSLFGKVPAGVVHRASEEERHDEEIFENSDDWKLPGFHQTECSQMRRDQDFQGSRVLHSVPKNRELDSQLALFNSKSKKAAVQNSIDKH